jgi:uncharacterized protein YijF (DUF1287 family)
VDPAPATSGKTAPPSARVVANRSTPTALRVAAAAEGQVGTTVHYDAAYVRIAYPGGDVPADRGACTDVVIRAFRAVGVDLQAAVHKDMVASFGAYPHMWDLTKPDPNIDHRRVPNLQRFFERKKKSLSVTKSGADYQPGDVVTWKLWGRPHTGVVSTKRAADGTRFLMVHNIGAGARIEDVLFEYEITGHYRDF